MIQSTSKRMQSQKQGTHQKIRWSWLAAVERFSGNTCAMKPLIKGQPSFDFGHRCWERITPSLLREDYTLLQHWCPLKLTGSKWEQTCQITPLLRSEAIVWWRQGEFPGLHFSAILDVTSALWSSHFEKFSCFWMEPPLIMSDVNGRGDGMCGEAHGGRHFGSGKWILRRECVLVSATLTDCMFR